MKQINKDEVSIVWISDKYDGTLIKGHCWYNKEYCYIKSNGPWSKVTEYRLYRLEGLNLLNELANRKLFEDIVGYHLTENIKNCSYSPCNSREEMKLFYDKMRDLTPNIDVKNLKLLGGWDIDNSAYYDEQDDDEESTD